jgi:hypothetical protein
VNCLMNQSVEGQGMIGPATTLFCSLAKLVSSSVGTAPIFILIVGILRGCIGKG